MFVGAYSFLSDHHCHGRIHLEFQDDWIKPFTLDDWTTGSNPNDDLQSWHPAAAACRTAAAAAVNQQQQQHHQQQRQRQ